MRPVLLALLLTLGFGGSASAQNEAPLSNSYEDLFVRVAVTAADESWAQYGFKAPCPAELLLYDSPNQEESIAIADGTDYELGVIGCRVKFDRRYRSFLWRVFSEPTYSYTLRRLAFAVMCGIAAHEEGHRIGFTFPFPDKYHVPYPWHIMYPHTKGRVIPTNCIRWATKLVPAGRKMDRTRVVSLKVFSTK